MPLTNSGKRFVGKPRNASRSRTAGATMPRAKLDTTRGGRAVSSAATTTPGYRNNAITAQSQWGGIAPTGKAAAQAAILQFAGASGTMGIIYIIGTYVLSVSIDEQYKEKKLEPKVFLSLPIASWLYIKGFSYMFGFIYGILMKMYWKCNDYQGRSKVRTFFVYLVLDFILACWNLVAILVNLKGGEIDFYWFFIIMCCLSIILIPCEIVKVVHIIDSEMQRKANEKERKTRRKNNGEQQRQQQQQRGMRQGEDIESKVSVDSIESKLTDGNGNMPTAVASPVNTNVGHMETNINQFQPSAPASLNGIELNIPTHNNNNNNMYDFTLVKNAQLKAAKFEEMWVNMQPCGGFHSGIQYYPEISTLNEHLKSRDFGIIASGLVGTGTRLFLYAIEDHQFTSRPGYEQASGIFLCEIVLSTSENGEYYCKATYKCSKPGLVDTFQNYLMLHEVFGEMY